MAVIMAFKMQLVDSNLGCDRIIQGFGGVKGMLFDKRLKPHVMLAWEFSILEKQTVIKRMSCFSTRKARLTCVKPQAIGCCCIDTMSGSPLVQITGFSELKIIRLRPIVFYQRAAWKSKMG